MTDEIRDFLGKIANPFQLENAEDITAKVLLTVEGPGGGSWVADCKNNVCAITEGTVEKPDLEVKATAEDTKKLITGELDPVKAFMGGKVKVVGNMFLGMKLLKSIKLPGV